MVSFPRAFVRAGLGLLAISNALMGYACTSFGTSDPAPQEPPPDAATSASPTVVSDGAPLPIDAARDNAPVPTVHYDGQLMTSTTLTSVRGYALTTVSPPRFFSTESGLVAAEVPTTTFRWMLKGFEGLAMLETGSSNPDAVGGLVGVSLEPGGNLAIGKGHGGGNKTGIAFTTAGGFVYLAQLNGGIVFEIPIAMNLDFGSEKRALTLGGPLGALVTPFAVSANRRTLLREGLTQDEVLVHSRATVTEVFASTGIPRKISPPLTGAIIGGDEKTFYAHRTLSNGTIQVLRYVRTILDP